MNKARYLFSKSALYRVLYTIKSPETRRSFREFYPIDASLRRKAWLAWLLYGMTAKGFYRLSCENKSFKEIAGFVSYFECKHLYSVINSVAAGRLLGNKYLSYQRFPAFYKRDVELITSEDISSGLIKKKVSDFINLGNTQVVVKPLRANRGQGVGVFDNVDDICNLLISCGGGVLEGLIKQHKDLSAFNDSSVNTLRIQTVNYGNGDIEILWPCLRMGHAGSFVDNAGAGGIFGAIDMRTGAIIGAADEKQHFYTEHPDSHKSLIGFVIPFFSEACELVRQTAEMIPEATIVGWDLALTDNGWVLVEGNSGPLIIWQIAAGQGIREKYRQIEKRTVFRKN